MKKRIVLLLASLLMLAGCGSSSAPTGAPAPAQTVQEKAGNSQTEAAGTEAISTAAISAEAIGTEAISTEALSAEETETDSAEAAADTSGTETENSSDTLVIYFSRTGEQYTVGVIDKGNTAIVAEMIAKETGAELFEVLPEEDYYPYTYSELTDVAKKEQNENARPVYQGSLPDLSSYSTVFIGAPVWWGDWPMIMYTVFENNDFSGKTLIPFSTHEGSGLSGFDRKLQSACPDAEVLRGLAVRGNDAQNNQDKTREAVSGWLDELGF